jgi:hypothetical protein
MSRAVGRFEVARQKRMKREGLRAINLCRLVQSAGSRTRRRGRGQECGAPQRARPGRPRADADHVRRRIRVGRDGGKAGQLPHRFLAAGNPPLLSATSRGGDLPRATDAARGRIVSVDIDCPGQICGIHGRLESVGVRSADRRDIWRHHREQRGVSAEREQCDAFATMVVYTGRQHLGAARGDDDHCAGPGCRALGPGCWRSCSRPYLRRAVDRAACCARPRTIG